MTHTPKIRMIAGPNGSGKSSFMNDVRKNNFFTVHNFINSDEIQVQISKNNQIDLSKYSIATSKEIFDLFVSQSGFKPKIEEKNSLKIKELYTFDNNVIKLINVEKSSYFAAMIADFAREQLLEMKVSFEFETVMSHAGKIEFLQKAKLLGYKIYLYFLCCESPQINKINVTNRVSQGGHFVPKETIEDRYYKTLDNLFLAVNASDISFIIQNNINSFTHIATIKSRELAPHSSNIPLWFDKYYLQKLTN